MPNPYASMIVFKKQHKNILTKNCNSSILNWSQDWLWSNKGDNSSIPVEKCVGQDDAELFQFTASVFWGFENFLYGIFIVCLMLNWVYFSIYTSKINILSTGDIFINVHSWNIFFGLIEIYTGMFND